MKIHAEERLAAPGRPTIADHVVNRRHLSENAGDWHSGGRSVSVRLIAFVLLAAVALPSGAPAREASREMVVCHDYATRKYIADFRQIGATQRLRDDEVPVIVTAFENDSLRYEDYLAECLKRHGIDKANK